VEKQWVSVRQRKARKVTKPGSSFLCLWVPDPETFPAEVARRNYTVKKRVDAARSEERRKSDQSMLKMSVRKIQKR
jgi:predicted transcriptional regulator